MQSRPQHMAQIAAQQNRPASLDNLTREVRRLFASGLTCRDICAVLGLHSTVVERLVAEARSV